MLAPRLSLRSPSARNSKEVGFRKSNRGKWSLQVMHCDFPDDAFFDVENDVWLKPAQDSADTCLTLGITSVLSFLAGRFRKVELKSEKTSVSPGQSIATVESEKYFGAVRSPLKANIVKFNAKLESRPRILNDEPYGEGWVAELKDYDLDSLSKLPKGREAQKKLEARINELKIKCFKKLPDEQIASIGVECFSTLAKLNELLEKDPRGTIVHVVSDDPFAEIEMIRWSDQTRNEILESRFEGKLSHFLIEKK